MFDSQFILDLRNIEAGQIGSVDMEMRSRNRNWSRNQGNFLEIWRNDGIQLSNANRIEINMITSKIFCVDRSIRERNKRHWINDDKRRVQKIFLNLRINVRGIVFFVGKLTRQQTNYYQLPFRETSVNQLHHCNNTSIHSVRRVPKYAIVSAQHDESRRTGGDVGHVGIDI